MHAELHQPTPPDTKPQIVLRDYQQLAKNFVLTRPYSALHLPMAFGKTLTVLSSLQDIPLQGHVLVVAPINIAKIVWINEIEEWNFKLRHKSLILDDNGKPFRDKFKTKNKVKTKIMSAQDQRYARYEEVLLDKPTMYFVNNELVEDLTEWMIQNSTYWPFPTVIIDESQSFKNPTSGRFISLAKMRPDIHRIIELSGTPIPNGYLDLWSQVYLLDQGLSLGPNITWYKNTFFQVTKYRNNAPIKWEPLPFAVDTIKQRTQHLIMSADNTDLKLPPQVPNEIKLHLDEALMEKYKRFREDFVIDFAQTLEPDGIIGDIIEQIKNEPLLSQREKDRQIKDLLSEAFVASGGVLRNKSLQFASGQIYLEDSDEYEIIHNEKLEAMALIIQEADSNIIVGYRYKSELHRMLHEMPKLIDRPVVKFNGTREMEAAWNRREIPVMVAHPASAGHGMNFQRGGHNLAWWTLPDSSEHFGQMNARQARPGQPNDKVYIHRLRCVGTEDDNQMPRLEKKLSVQDDFLNSFKRNVTSVASSRTRNLLDAVIPEMI